MEKIWNNIRDNMTSIKWMVIIGMLFAAFLFASCARKTYESSEKTISMDSLVLKTFFNSSFVWKDSTVIVLNEVGDTVKTKQKTFVATDKEKIVYKDKYKYIDRVKTVKVTVEKKYIPKWIIFTLIISFGVNLLFIVCWIKKKGFY